MVKWISCDPPKVASQVRFLSEVPPVILNEIPIMRVPVDIVLHKQSKAMELVYEEGTRYLLPYEFLRVLSPSAEVQGHSPDEAVLLVGKRDVRIV